jgi:hypothetical protein
VADQGDTSTFDLRSNGVFQRIPAERWNIYFAALSRGDSRAKAAKEAGIALRSADRVHNEPRKSSGWEFYKRWLADSVHDVVPYGALTPNARKGYNDFEFFRRRYFGHISKPWHIDAAKRIVEHLAAPEKTFLVINCPPGSGKSTLMTHDIPLWCVVRNRTLRTLIGTGAETTGQDYLRRIRTSLERTIPVEADEIDEAMGLAVDAKSTLVHDFGRFKPDSASLWNSDKLVVSREGGAPAHQKEASFSVYGRKSQFLGSRVNLVIWDDVVNDVNSRTPTQQEELSRWWKSTAESRLEPGGLLVLQGQRLGPHDLYRYALDLKDITAFDGEFVDLDPEKMPRKYHHIIFKAHYPEKCAGGGPKEPHHDPATAEPWPKGCLLDPQRLTYRDLRTIEYNDPKSYATVYQQEDTDPGSVLVDPIWIAGGPDPKTGVIHPGCWDPTRQVGQWPEHLAGDVYSVVTADPSPSQFWGCIMSAYQVDTQFTHVIDVVRKKMGAPEFLDFNHATGRFSGLLEQWWQDSNDAGRPVTHVIVEENAAQKFLLQYDHAKRWGMQRGVQLIGHHTGGHNKSDPKLGVGALAPEFRHGRIRLPGHPLTKPFVLPIYSEVTRYPDSATTDMVMSLWFLLWNRERLFRQRMTEPYRFARPEWIQDRRRGLRAV